MTIRYRLSYAMHRALIRRLLYLAREAVNESGSSTLSTSCQLPPVTRALYLLPDQFTVRADVYLLAARKLNYLSLSLTIDGISASAAGPCSLVLWYLTWGSR